MKPRVSFRSPPPALFTEPKSPDVEGKCSHCRGQQHWRRALASDQCSCAVVQQQHLRVSEQ
eukprot:6202417-Pleurochrysis_carterae.AAC.3